MYTEDAESAQALDVFYPEIHVHLRPGQFGFRHLIFGVLLFILHATPDQFNGFYGVCHFGLNYCARNSEQETVF